MRPNKDIKQMRAKAEKAYKKGEKAEFYRICDEIQKRKLEKRSKKVKE